MKIALYYPWIYLKSGIEKTILELTRRSKHTWTVFTNHYSPETTYEEFKERTVIELKRISVQRSYPQTIKTVITLMQQKIDLREFDALWVHSAGIADLITLRNHDKPLISFCHTPLKVIHDPCIRAIYEHDIWWKRTAFGSFRLLYNILDHRVWHYYDHVFCTSQEVKQRILKAGLYPENDLEIIYRGVDPEHIKPSSIYEPYFLLPARIKWWKNIELAVNAFIYFREHYPDLASHFKLIIAGQVDRGSMAYTRELHTLIGKDKNIRLIEDPSDKEFSELFRNSYGVLSTTLNEDWGITILEAMAYGKPVIAVNKGGPTESVRDGETGFLVPPTPEAFAEKMRLLAQDPILSKKLGTRARKHALQYDWSFFAQRVDAYLNTLSVGAT